MQTYTYSTSSNLSEPTFIGQEMDVKDYFTDKKLEEFNSNIKRLSLLAALIMAALATANHLILEDEEHVLEQCLPRQDFV